MKREGSKNYCNIVIERGFFFLKLPNGEPVPGQIDITVNDTTKGLAIATVSFYVNLGETTGAEIAADDPNAADNEKRAKIGLGPMLEGEHYALYDNGVRVSTAEFKKLSGFTE